MKTLSVFFVTILFAAYSATSAESGKLESNGDVIIYDSHRLERYWYSAAALESYSEASDSPCIAKAGLSGTALSSNPSGDGNGHAFLTDLSRVSQLERSAAKTDSLQLQYANAGMPPASDLVNPGFSPPFISGAIHWQAESLPGSSTMLVMGLGLIGLAGYGGRKKFKR